MWGTALADAELAAVALLTAAVHDEDVASLLAFEVALQPTAHRLLVALVLLDRGLTWSPSWTPVHGEVCQLVEAMRYNKPGRALVLLSRAVGRGLPAARSGSFLICLAYAVAHAVDQPQQLVREWALCVAAGPRTSTPRELRDP